MTLRRGFRLQGADKPLWTSDFVLSTVTGGKNLEINSLVMARGGHV
ncbi:MAG: hypothetical protein K2G13_06115 [Muribaculaceae bacterium]|nr:hypothetical protein [Muribaculaceae bacterium]